MSDWLRILLEVGLHYVVIHLAIAFARRTRWILFIALSAVVSGFVLYIVLAIPAATPADLVRVEGVFENYTLDSGHLFIHLRDDSRVFGVYDSAFFQQEQFIQEVKSGDAIVLAVLRTVQDQTSPPLVLFEVSAHGKAYLPMEPVLKERGRDRTVTLPIILTCSALVFAITLIAAFRPRPIYDTILGSFIGTLLMLVLDFYFPKTNLTSLIPILALLGIYPALLLTENRFREFDRTSWLIAGMTYVAMVAFAGVSLLLVLSH